MEIEKGVPMPASVRLDRGRHGELREVLSKMEVFDSVRACDRDDRSERARWEVNAQRYRRASGRRFTIRQHEDHIRVWRIA